MIYFLLRLPQLDTVNNLFTRLEPTMGDRLQKLPYADLFEMAVAPAGVYVFTGLDQLSKAQKQVAAQVWDRLRADGSVVLNRPEHAMDRFELLSTLHSLGLNDFRAFRASAFEKMEATYPVFVRSNSQHTGPLSPLLHSPSEVEHALRRARLWGHAEDDLLVVEYCHIQDEDGYFRKYSAFRIGDAIIPCYLEHGDDWDVKRTRSRPKAGAPDLADEELRFVQQNPHEVALKRVFEIARIEYGRIDYAIRNNRLQVWEINSAPSFGQSAKRRSQARENERKARFQARMTFLGSICETLDSLDASVESGQTAIEFDRDLLGQIQRDVRVERAFVRAERVRDAARSMGLSRLGRLKTPLSWLLGRVLNRLG